MSKKVGYDVGTPIVVDRLIALAQQAKVETSRLGLESASFQDRPLMGWLRGFHLPQSREEIIKIYLQGDGFPEELRRFGARIYKKDPTQTEINGDLIDRYCADNFLSQRFAGDVKTNYL